MRDLHVGDRVIADDALGHLAIGDRLHLQRVHAAEIGDLREGQRGLLDQPHRGGLRHQGQAHRSCPSPWAAVRGAPGGSIYGRAGYGTAPGSGSRPTSACYDKHGDGRGFDDADR